MTDPSHTPTDESPADAKIDFETAGIKTENFVDIDDVTPAELQRLLNRAIAMKAGDDDSQLPDASLGMLFEKPSTRTRISFETGMTQLGGHALFLGPDDIQLGHGEPLRDTARVLGRYVDAVMARLYDHEDIETLAKYAGCPVINGLTDDAHPCQTLADLLTIHENFDEDVSVAWIGDGNNVGQSFVVGAAMAGLDVTIATPPEHTMDEAVFDRAGQYDGNQTSTTDPETAVDGADVIYTDVWVSMGEEDKREEKLADFDGFQVNKDLLEGSDAMVMHCLPAHRGEEITNDVLESDRSLVWDQAENRLHAQKALLVELVD